MGASLKQGINDFETWCKQNNKEYLLIEWDYEKNGSIAPVDVMHGVPKKVWWKCKKGHSWEASLSARSKGNNCPYCAGQWTLVGLNDLKTINPDFLKEWDYDKNKDISPQDVKINSGIKVWWRCEKGHEWLSTIANRNRGNNCPYCSNKKVLKGYNDLSTTAPQLLKEWNFNKNKDISPYQITKNSHKKVWWICENQHEWEAVVSSRAKGVGCPICRKEMHTSFSEQSIYFYVKRYFSNAINSYKLNNKLELDIYIPEKHIGIEYDGRKWHMDIEKDNKKNEICKSKGIFLFRLREEGCPIMKETSNLKIINVPKSEKNKSDFDVEYAVLRLFKYMGINADINLNRDKQKILSMYLQNKKENSLESLYPGLVKEWNYARNGNLSPSLVTVGTPKKVWWVCKEGHEWVSSISSRVAGSGCPYCSGKLPIEGKTDLKTCHPELVKEWNYKKNIGLSPSDFTRSSGQKVWWICEKGHEWQAEISNRVTGRGCPYCSNKGVLRGYNDLATTNPNLVKEWDFERNGNITPYNITNGSAKKVHWVCQYGHKYESRIQDRVLHHQGCPYCANKKVLRGFNDLATTNPELLIDWDFKKNTEITPYTVTRRSGKKVWWKCHVCSTEWFATIASKRENTGCPICAKKRISEKKKKKIINLDTNEIFDSVSDAVNVLGFVKRNYIIDCCKNRREQAYGYHWAYYENK